MQSGEDWIARLDDDLSRPVETSGDSFRISALQKEDPVCMTLHAWVVANEFPAWAEVKRMLPELRSLWHHHNNFQELRNSYVITKSTEHAPLRRFFKAAVDGLQMVFGRSLVTSVQPKSLLVQMREAVANCDDVSSDGSLMLLSQPHDIPEATLPLQHLEAGRLGASTPQHVRSRPTVPDLCITSSSLLSVIDPLPMDRLSRHTVAEIRSWPAADRHDLLAVANRDVRVARQNIAELLLYVDDHAAHLASCASADDDSRRSFSPVWRGGSGRRWRRSTLCKLLGFMAGHIN